MGGGVKKYCKQHDARETKIANNAIDKFIETRLHVLPDALKNLSEHSSLEMRLALRKYILRTVRCKL